MLILKEAFSIIPYEYVTDMSTNCSSANDGARALVEHTAKDETKVAWSL